MNRSIEYVITSRPTIEGAGVELRRGFGFQELPDFDPFLLFDDFSSEYKESYIAGFPWHPHRGIQTVTYILNGTVAHQDSIGNRGTITGGEVQWMSAGSGIIHQEMPEWSPRGIEGFQLWVNIPASNKMDAPEYQQYNSTEFPAFAFGNNAEMRLIAGTIDQYTGPVNGMYVQPIYMDISIGMKGRVEIPVNALLNSFLYIISGTISVADSNTGTVIVGEKEIILFKQDGDSIVIENAGNEKARILCAAGTPLEETIAWKGPIVMNTEKQIQEAFTQIHNGSFIQ